MVKQLKKVGNGNALFLDKAILELVGLEEGGEVQLTVRNGSIIIAPVRPKLIDKKKFEASLDRVVTKRREVLRRLAE
jgi:antitoxin component of MazEF toxin-antitoxin module